jgi:hypothetical protein
MRWFKSDLRSSFFALFTAGRLSAPTESVPHVGVEDIRDAMLALAGNLEDKRFAHVGRRIRYAADAVGLWYLRADLMAMLASRDGEVQAREQVRAITEMFEHLLPQGLKSRPSPLAALASQNDSGALSN